MTKRHFLLNRLKTKTWLYYFITRLNTHFDLSLAEAEILSKEILEEVANANGETLSEGQIWYTAIHKEEPAGKSLAQCRKVRVKLTLHHIDDLNVGDISSLKAILVHRLSWEAIEQDGALTIEDLSRILFTSEKTIRRLLAVYRNKEVFIPIRGYYKDIGPGTTHKSQAVRLYLKGFQPSKIANYLAHHIQSIERYLDDFCLVMMALEEGYGPVRIARNTKLSERTVKEYQALYEACKNEPDYQVTLGRLRERLAYLLKKKKDAKAAGEER